MKKIWFVLGLVLALLLTGCIEEPKTTEPTAVRGSEAALEQTAFADWNQSSMGRLFFETPDGYYYMAPITVDNPEVTHDDVISLAFFCPKGGDCFVPLCSKPNCMHCDENCNAYTGRWPLAFAYYDDALYYVMKSFFYEDACDVYSVVKMDLDGSDHRVIKTVDDRDYPNVESWTFRFHRGKLFAVAEASADLPPNLQKPRLIVVNLKDGSQTEPAAEYLCKEGLPWFESFYKDKLYGIMPGAGGESDRLMEIDMATGEVQTPLPGPTDGIYRTDDTLYYYVSPKSESETWSAGFHAYDRQSGEIQDYGQPTEDIYTALWDEDYIYAFSPYRDENWTERTMYFLSGDYKPQDRLELTNGMDYVCATSDRVFFGDLDALQVFYIDKSEIGSGTLNLKPMETVCPSAKSE